MTRPTASHFRQKNSQRRSRRLLVESLESRRVLAPVITALNAPPANEGSALTLTVDFTEPTLLANAYTLHVNWGDGTPTQVAPVNPANIQVLNAGTGEMRTTISRTYTDDAPTGTASDPRTITAAMFDTSLVSYWNFDEAAGPTALDFTGTNNGTIGGTVTRQTGLVGPGSLQFNNVGGDTVNVGAGPSLDATTGLALEALIRPTWNGAGGDYDEIFRKEDGNQRILFSFQNDGNNGGARIPVAPGPVLSFGVDIGGYSELDMPLNVNLAPLPGGNPSSGAIYLNNPGGVLGPNDVVLRDGLTHHVAATYDQPTGVRSIYVDGVLRWSVQEPPGTPLNAGGGVPGQIGNTGGLNEPFTGLMDEVAFYNRGLTAQAIADHAARGIAGQNYFFKTTTSAINNVAPTFDLGADAPISEGGTFTRTVTITDAGTDTFTATVDYGDGSGVQPLTVTGNSFTLNRAYPNDGPFTVTVVVTDDDTGSFSDSLTVNVQNAAPVVQTFTTSTPSISEGQTASITLTYSDAGVNDVHSAMINWGDGNITPGTVNQATDTVTGTHPYADEGTGSFNVTVTVSDGLNSTTSGPIAIAVSNVPPVIPAGQTATTPEDSTTAFLLANFTDPGDLDVHTATINWGDLSAPSNAIINQTANTISGSHAYATPGTYTATITINDGDGGTDVETVQVTVTNVAPEVTIDAPDTTVRNQPTTFRLSTDDGAADPDAPVTYEIDWNDGSEIEIVEGTAGETIVQHVFAAEGDFVVSVTATDEFDDTSDPAEHPITVIPFGLVPNDETGGDDLVFGGTHLADRIVVSLLHDGRVQVRMNNEFFKFTDITGKIKIFGGEGGDTIQITGSIEYDTELSGGDGNDYIAGGRFNDILDGGAGNDRLLDNLGLNTMIGGAGNDTISAGRNDDFLFGGDGNDTLKGAAGNDVMDGGAGNDRLFGQDGHDIMFGGLGNDQLTGDRGHDVIDGGAGNDLIRGKNGRDILIGGIHADQIYGSIDDDILVHSSVDYGNSGDPDTQFENDVAVMQSMRDDWILALAFETRMDLLSDRLNESTIEDDNARDSLYGEGDRDWFLTSSQDSVKQLKPEDFRQDLS